MPTTEQNSKDNSRLKITLLTTSFPRFQDDSAGIFIYQFAKHLAELNCSLNVVAPHDTEVRPQDFSQKAGVHFFKYFYPLEFQSFAYKGGMANRIKNNWLRIFQLPFFMIGFFIKALRVSKKSDVIHAYWSLAGVIALMIKVIRPKPVIFTIWGSDILFTRIPVIATFFRFFLKQADAIICESQDFKNHLLDFGIHDETISIIPNGIDYNNFKPDDKLHCRDTLGLPKDKLIILAVGSLIAAKGHQFLIDSIPGLISNQFDLQFVFIGEGEYRSELENQAQFIKVIDKITFAGQQQVSQIPLWMNSADIFVHPSLSEGTPNSVIEAMACELPVLATTVGDIPNIIDDGKDGFLVSPGDSRQLTSKLNRLIQDEKLRQQFGLSGMHKVRSKFGDLDTQAQLILKVYRGAMSHCV